MPPTWEEIVEQHSARVYRLAYRLTGNVHDAEDLTQDVFIRVFRSLHTYQPGTFEGWLHRITTNVFLDKMRRKQRIRFDALSDESAARLPSRERRARSSTSHDAHFDDDVQRALDALAPDFRAAVVLCDIEGLSYEEVAATLGIKLGTVRSRIHRGRAQLREALAHRAPAARHDDVLAPGPARVQHRAGRAAGPGDGAGRRCERTAATWGRWSARTSTAACRPASCWAWDQHLVVCGSCRAVAEEERRLMAVHAPGAGTEPVELAAVRAARAGRPPHTDDLPAAPGPSCSPVRRRCTARPCVPPCCAGWPPAPRPPQP